MVAMGGLLWDGESIRVVGRGYMDGGDVNGLA